MNKKTLHGDFFLKSTFFVALLGSFIFALSLALLLNNILKNTVSSDTSDDYGYLSSQNFSASSISDFPSSKDCQSKNLGQVVLVSDIDLSDDVAKRVEVAVSTGGFFTKRGSLKKISPNYIEKLSQTYTTSTGQGIDKEKLKTGLYFTDVPIDDKLLVQMYSPDWGELSVKNDVKAIGKACQTVFLYVPIEMARKKGDFDVCVHGRDKSNDYLPKKTFVYPSEKQKISDFKNANGDLIVSLGPCQDGAILLGRTNLAQPLSISEGDVDSQAETTLSSDDASEIKPTMSNDDASVETVSGEGVDEQTFFKQALQELNKMREERGVPPLVNNDQMNKHAKERLKYITKTKNCPSHDGVDQYFASNPILSAENAGWRVPPSDGNTAMRQYQESPDHYATIINKEYKSVGFAVGEAFGKRDGMNGQCNLEVFSKSN